MTVSNPRKSFIMDKVDTNVIVLDTLKALP